MPKVLLQAHTNDEHGVHVPDDVLDLSDGEANAYVEKNWGIILPEDKRGIETPESRMAKHETADIPVGDDAGKDEKSKRKKK